MDHISTLFGEINEAFEKKSHEPVVTNNKNRDVPEGKYEAKVLEVAINSEKRIVMKLNIIDGFYKNQWLWIFLPAIGDNINITRTAFWRMGIPLLTKQEQEEQGKEVTDFATQLMNHIDYLNEYMPVIKISRKQVGDYTNNYIDGVVNDDVEKVSSKISASSFAHDDEPAPVIPRGPVTQIVEPNITVDKIKAIFNS